MKGKPTIIMISGKSNSGKGTVADGLKSYLEQIKSYNGRILKCSLSACIRTIARDYFFWDGIDTVNSRKFMAETYRLATELLDYYHMARGVWIRDILPFVARCPYHETLIIIESFREIQNWEFFQKLKDDGYVKDVITIRVDRPGADVETVDGDLKQHVSEVDLDDFEFDFYCDNSGTLEELPWRIGELARKLSKRGI